MHRRLDAKTLLAFAAVYVIWGSTYLAIRIGLEHHVPPALFAGTRFVLAGLIMLAFARLRRWRLRLSRYDLITVAVVGIFLLCGGMYFTVLAEQYIPSSLSALVVAVVPLWVAAAEWMLPGMERPSARGVTGLVIGFTGLAVLMWPRVLGVHGSGMEWLGVGLQILGTWLWTTGSLISRARPVKANAVVATGYEMLIAGCILLGIGVVSGELSSVSNVTSGGLWALAYLTVFGSCVAFTAFVWLLAHVQTSKVMTYTYVNPVIAVFLGWAAGALGIIATPEPIDAWVIAGMAIIVVGVALTTTAPARPPRVRERVGMRHPSNDPALSDPPA
ncbi:MAG: EamA family transporter [Coriobacteriia bacterium]|jgi:drug/metabolite transporter (DMT)-like permease|nr:EamA family transporter [Coriobacteriia bacterium]